MHPVTIHGPRLILRELRPDDAIALRRIVGDPEVTETLIFEPKTLPETETYIADMSAKARAIPRMIYYLAVEEADTREFVATGALSCGEQASGAIGYAVRRDRWGRGYATEVTRALIAFGFATLGLHRVWASHGPANPPSGKVLLNAGMTYEGTLRHTMFVRGGWRDSLTYAVLPDEWNDTGEFTVTIGADQP